MSHRRRNHSHGFISIFTIIALLARRQWLRQLRATCPSDASHAQLLGIMYWYHYFGFRLGLYGMMLQWMQDSG